MGFYEQISNYYDYIFPVGRDQVDFIQEVSGAPPKRILDIACGTGGYSLTLSKLGYRVTAVDIDFKMVEILKQSAAEQKQDINIIQTDMLTLADFIKYKFDTVFCIGNSIVHLDSIDQVGRVLISIRQLLHKGGQAVFQIVNYDRILRGNITELPTIHNKEINLRFERLYKYNDAEGKIYFHTKLYVEDKLFENEIPLLPIISADFISLLNVAGFKKIELYGDFKYSKYDSDSSYALVVKAC